MAPLRICIAGNSLMLTCLRLALHTHRGIEVWHTHEADDAPTPDIILTDREAHTPALDTELRDTFPGVPIFVLHPEPNVNAILSLDTIQR